MKPGRLSSNHRDAGGGSRAGELVLSRRQNPGGANLMNFRILSLTTLRFAGSVSTETSEVLQARGVETYLEPAANMPSGSRAERQGIWRVRPILARRGGGGGKAPWSSPSKRWCPRMPEVKRERLVELGVELGPFPSPHSGKGRLSQQSGRYATSPPGSSRRRLAAAPATWRDRWLHRSSGAPAQAANGRRWRPRATTLERAWPSQPASLASIAGTGPEMIT